MSKTLKDEGNEKKNPDSQSPFNLSIFKHDTSKTQASIRIHH